MFYAPQKEDRYNGGMGFGCSNPTIQIAGAQRLIEKDPREIMESGDYATDIPIMFGANKQEGTLVLTSRFLLIKFFDWSFKKFKNHILFSCSSQFCPLFVIVVYQSFLTPHSYQNNTEFLTHDIVPSLLTALSKWSKSINLFMFQWLFGKMHISIK